MILSEHLLRDRLCFLETPFRFRIIPLAEWILPSFRRQTACAAEPSPPWLTATFAAATIISRAASNCCWSDRFFRPLAQAVHLGDGRRIGDLGHERHGPAHQHDRKKPLSDAAHRRKVAISSRGWMTENEGRRDGDEGNVACHEDTKFTKVHNEILLHSDSV